VLEAADALHFTLGQPAGLFKLASVIVLRRAPTPFEQFVTDMLDAEALLGGLARPRLIGHLTITPIAWITPIFPQRSDAAPFNFEPAFTFMLAQQPALPHFADVALEAFVTGQFAGIEAPGLECEFALRFRAMRQLLPHLADLGQYTALLAELPYQLLVVLAQLSYPLADQALLRGFCQPTLDLLLPTLGGLQFERRLALVGAELPLAMKIANSKDHLLETAAIFSFVSMTFELAFGPVMLPPGLFELMLGPFERRPTNHRPCGLVKLMLRDFSVMEQLSSGVSKGLLQPVAPLPFFVGRLNLQSRQLVFELVPKRDDLDGPLPVPEFTREFSTEPEFRMLP
jgi:hypothetical protein